MSSDIGPDPKTHRHAVVAAAVAAVILIGCAAVLASALTSPAAGAPLVAGMPARPSVVACSATAPLGAERPAVRASVVACSATAPLAAERPAARATTP